MRYASDASELIGNTPLLSLLSYTGSSNVFAKCEFLNPLSLKDRPVLQILREAEESGRIQKGSTLIEATSGNTGMAVASLAAIRGYKAILVMSEIQSLERRQVLRALGAELILTPAALGTKGARAKLQEILAEHPDYFYIGQHQNPANPRAHYLSTGPELWEQTDGEIDVLVAGLGTGGTLCGAGRYLKEQKGSVQVVGVEPKEAPFIKSGEWAPHRLMGTAPGFVPETLDREQIDAIELVTEEEAFAACRALARQSGILVGISAGASAHAAAQIAKREGMQDACIVCVLADTGQRYLSVEGLFES